MNRSIVHPLLVLVILVATVIGLLQVIDEAWATRYFDPPMLTVIVVAYLTAALVMLTSTGLRGWTVLSAGLLATMLGDAMLYAYILMPQVGIAVPFEEVWVAMIRALLVVGGPFVLAGLVREEIKAVRRRREMEGTRIEQATTTVRQAARDRELDARADEADKRAARQDTQQALLDATTLINTERAKVLSEAGVSVDDRRVAMDEEQEDVDDREYEVSRREGEEGPTDAIRRAIDDTDSNT